MVGRVVVVPVHHRDVHAFQGCSRRAMLQHQSYSAGSEARVADVVFMASTRCTTTVTGKVDAKSFNWIFQLHPRLSRLFVQARSYAAGMQHHPFVHSKSSRHYNA